MFNFDFTNVKNSTPPSAAGVYQVKINSVEAYESQTGNARIRLRATVEEGKHKGCSITDGINLPKAPEDKVLGIWLRFFNSLGMSPSEVQETFAKDFKTMDEAADHIAKHINDLVGYCYYAPAVDDNSWPTRKWVTADQYTSSQDIKEGKGNGKTTDALNDFMSF